MSLTSFLKTVLLLFLFLLVMKPSAFAQNDEFPPDIKGLLEKSAKQSAGLEQRVEWGNQAYQRGVELKDSSIQVEAKYAVVKALSDHGKFVDALLILDYLTTLERDQSSDNYAFILNKYGLCYYRLGMTNRSIEKFREAKEIFEKNNNMKQVLSCLNNIASVYYASRQYELARENLEEVVRLSEEKGVVVGSAEYNLGVSNLYLEDFGHAEKHLLKAVEIAKEEKDSEALLLNYSKLGMLYSKLGNREKSRLYMELSAEPMPGMTVKTQGFILLDHIYVFYEEGNIAAAGDRLFRLKRLIERTDLHDIKLKMYGEGMRIAKKKRDMDQYISFSEQHQRLSDSLNAAQDLIELDVYDRLASEQDKNKHLVIDQKNLEAADQEKSLKIVAYERNIYRIVLWSLLFLVAAAVVIFWLRRRARQISERNKSLRHKSDELEYNLKVKRDQLTDLALYLGQNKQLLMTILDRLKKHREEYPGDIILGELIAQISEVVRINKDQQKFYDFIEEINAAFVSRVKQAYPQLTNNDLRLISLIRLNLSSKEIASFSNISPRSVDVNRHRLRKKLGLKRGESIASIDL